MGGANKVFCNNVRDKKRTLLHQRRLDPILSFSSAYPPPQPHDPRCSCPLARTKASFKRLDHVGVAVCGPDGFTSINEGGVGGEVTPGSNKGADVPRVTFPFHRRAYESDYPPY